MQKIIRGGKTTVLYSQEDHRIGFRGEVYDYILIILITVFVIGFIMLQAS
ncbi:hypothetical protein HYX18_03000 [Candidatus Woesearchaeota archaeon]|nr:hypothetical protein [Candidatus Woesearchaeota archaeon]